MSDGNDGLTSALRDLAAEDARLAPATPSPAARAALRGLAVSSAGHSAGLQHGKGSRALGWVVAASLAAAIVGALWLTSRARVEPPPRVEIATAFMPLQYQSVPYTEARLVRMEVPRSVLTSFGLTSVEAADANNETVLADVLVGEDGLARAVRFVRPSGAQGVAP